MSLPMTGSSQLMDTMYIVYEVAAPSSSTGNIGLNIDSFPKQFEPQVFVLFYSRLQMQQHLPHFINQILQPQSFQDQVDVVDHFRLKGKHFSVYNAIFIKYKITQRKLNSSSCILMIFSFVCKCSRQHIAHFTNDRYVLTTSNRDYD